MPAQNLPKKRILVVDDEPMVCEAIGMMLSFASHEVVAAGSGKEALALFDQDKFDVVITDYHMPGMNGGELAQAVKARQPGQPVVMITADAEHVKSIPGALTGVDELIGKPFQFQELLDAVEKAAGR